MSAIRRWSILPATTLLMCLHWQPASAATDEELAEAGDIVQILLPVSGYVGAWITGDKEGAVQLTKALAAMGLTAQTIKFTADRLRPDGTDTRSFPSGHTTAAYGGAEFIRVRYGNAWGIPAHVAAAFVAYTRIRSQKHFFDDVLAGASNGMMWNWYFTSPYSEVLELRPIAMDDGYGVEFSYNFNNEIRIDADYLSKPKFKYSVEFGPVTQDKNIFASPADTGTEIDLATAENELDFTSRVFFQHFFKPRHEWGVYFSPLELKEFDPASTLTGPVDFAGKTFLPVPGSNFRTRYNLGELRASYRYSLIDNDKWYLKLGGGLQYTVNLLEIIQYDGEPKDNVVIEQAEAESTLVSLTGSGRVGYRFNEKWGLDYELDVMLSGESYLNTALMVNWRAAPGWEFALGGRYLSWDINDGNIRNELEWGDLMFRVSHNFF